MRFTPVATRVAAALLAQGSRRTVAAMQPTMSFVALRMMSTAAPPGPKVRLQ